MSQRSKATKHKCSAATTTTTRVSVLSIHSLAVITILVIMTSTLLPTSFGVDKTKFKSCEQSSFCQRHRSHKPFDQQWKLDLSSIRQDNNNVIGKLVDETSSMQLDLTLSLTDKGAMRVKIDQIDSQRKRFEAKDALNPQLKFKKLHLPIIEEDTATLTFGDNQSGGQEQNIYKLLLTSAPFKAEVFNDQNKLVVALNSRGLFKFESYIGTPDTLKNQPKPNLFGAPKAAAAYDEAGKPIGDGAGELEAAGDPIDASSDSSRFAETIATFTDTRPYGPMSVGMDIYFPHSDHLFGIPEHADSFSLKDTRPNIGDPYRLYNVDIFEYELQSPMSLYGAIPFMIAQSKTVNTFGVLWLNPSETWIDIESNNSQSKSVGVVDMLSNLVKSDSKMSGRLSHWFSETGLIDIWLMPGPDPVTVMKYNAEILGTIPMPPLYSIGFHQCRWNYFSSSEVMQVEHNYDKAEIPLDAIWLDIEYTEARSKKYFTWDPVSFVDHITMAQNLTANGRRLIAIIDPHIKKEDGYSCYEEGKSNGLWLKDSSGNDYEAWCWPGASYWPDYLSSKVRDWWASKFAPAHFPGDASTSVDIWNDMNEPSVFSGPEVTAPRDLQHIDGWEHRDLHNMYGFLMTQGTYQGLDQYRSHLNRPFILTRSFFAGSQRYAAAWTGDNQARWDHLKITVPMLLSLSVAGMPFVGADVGGFFNNPESEELVIRWHQAGALQPFFRNHAHHDARHREVYKFVGQTRNLLRDAIQLRYSYSPYWYTLFFEAHASGMPMMRPHWFHEPQDERTYEVEEQYYLGNSLLVRPVLDKGVESVQIYLPGQRGYNFWYDLNNHVMLDAGQTINYAVNIATVPIFQRVGTIVPRQFRMRKSLELGKKDPITLDVVLKKNEEGKLYARGHVYIDDSLTLRSDDSSAALKDILFFNNVIYVKASSSIDLGHGGVERIVIYNWPSDKNIKAIYNSENENSQRTKLHFERDNNLAGGFARIDIKKPQSSQEWSNWIITIETD